MKKMLFVVFAGLISIGCSSEVKKKQNRYNFDEVFKEDGFLFLKQDSTLVSGICYNHFDNGKLEFEITFKNGKEDGLLRFWFDNGEPQLEGHNVDGERHGLFKMWNKKGQLTELIFEYDNEISRKCWDEHGNKILCEIEGGFVLSDERDEKSYIAVQIGSQIWMAENLNTDKFCNGDPIPEVKTKEAWIIAGENKQPAWCYYKFNSKNSLFGKLYNYYAISDIRGLSPAGWHIPSSFEFVQLINEVDASFLKAFIKGNGTQTLAGGAFKRKKYWDGPYCNQIDCGFNAIAAGGCTYPHGDWEPMVARFWSLTNWNDIANILDLPYEQKIAFEREANSEVMNNKALYFGFNNRSCSVDFDDDPKAYGYSVRCIKY